MSRLRLKQVDDKIVSEKCKIYIQGMKQKPETKASSLQ